MRGGSQRAQLVGCVLLGASACADLSPAAKKNLNTALEIGKATTSSLLKIYICKAVERPYEVSGGSFVVPPGGCRASDAPDGDLILHVRGSGSRSGLVALTFTVDSSARYTLRWAGDHVYMLPKDATVGEPVVTSANGFAQIADSFGFVRSKTNEILRGRLLRPRTYIISQSCTVDGWIGPHDLPTACELSNGQRVRLGYVEPLTEAPAGWEADRGSGLNVGTTLAASRSPQLHRRTWNDESSERLKRWGETSAGSVAVAAIAIIHPTGKAAALNSFKVVDDGDRLSALLVIRWKGGVLGNTYETTVRWTIASTGHLHAGIDHDTAMIPVKPTNAAQLDEFFRSRVYLELPAAEASAQAQEMAAAPSPDEPVAPSPPPPPPPQAPTRDPSQTTGPGRRTAQEQQPAMPDQGAAKESRSEVPREAQLAFERGESAVKMNDLRVAELSYRESLAALPGWAPALNGLGTVLFKKGERGEAVSYFEAAAKADETLTLAWFNLGYAARKTGDFRTAATAYEKYTLLAPTDPDGFFGLGESYRQLGHQRAKAIEAYERYLALETRPTEQMWADQARQFIEQLSAGANR